MGCGAPSPGSMGFAPGSVAVPVFGSETAVSGGGETGDETPWSSALTSSTAEREQGLWSAEQRVALHERVERGAGRAQRVVANLLGRCERARDRLNDTARGRPRRTSRRRARSRRRRPARTTRSATSPLPAPAPGIHFLLHTSTRRHRHPRRALRRASPPRPRTRRGVRALRSRSSSPRLRPARARAACTRFPASWGTAASPARCCRRARERAFPAW